MPAGSEEVETTMRLTEFDAAEYVETANDVFIFLEEAMKTNHPAYIAQAIGVVARSRGMEKLSEQTGVSRQQLYKAFSEKGNPTLKTLTVVFDALGFELSLKKKKPNSEAEVA